MKKSILSLAVLVALSSSAFAYGGGMMGGGMQKGGMQGMGMQRGNAYGSAAFAGITLTPEQSQKMAIIQSEMRLEMVKQRDPNMTANMQKVFASGNFDKTAFTKLSTEKQAKSVELRAQYMEKMFNVLTKEQKDQFQANLKKLGA